MLVCSSDKVDFLMNAVRTCFRNEIILNGNCFCLCFQFISLIIWLIDDDGSRIDCDN